MVKPQTHRMQATIWLYAARPMFSSVIKTPLMAPLVSIFLLVGAAIGRATHHLGSFMI